MDRKALIRFFLAVFFITSPLVLASCGKDAVDHSALRGGETRETLSPVYFTGEAAMSYAAAKEIPEILDSLHCYCECKKNMGHKSLLTCYVTEHASDCDLCIDEALMASRLHKEGHDAVSIRKAVDGEFSRT